MLLNEYVINLKRIIFWDGGSISKTEKQQPFLSGIRLEARHANHAKMIHRSKYRKLETECNNEQPV
jgi:hypothetical protein